LRLAQASPGFKSRHLESLRFTGQILANDPSGRVYRFYVVSTDKGARGYWTSSHIFESSDADPDAEPMAGEEGYEALNEPGVTVSVEWTFH
jgi:hypothetical protein